ncbi:MAG TPA: hypothetical protein DCS93_25850 [Microscillaceae bacterium]|nr:hypothetical protein [Microscillaceae bacterium]
MNRQYFYVGPAAILQGIDLTQIGTKILSKQALLQWIEETEQTLQNHQLITTFIVTLQEELVISDRHSEHVMCAGGHQVLSAGEITFEVINKQVSVVAISNQSTGYCPEPSSWPRVAQALQKAGLEGLDDFTDAYEFRYCHHCKHINLIKDQVFECVVCENTLDPEWNLDQKN